MCRPNPIAYTSLKLRLARVTTRPSRPPPIHVASQPRARRGPRRRGGGRGQPRLEVGRAGRRSMCPRRPRAERDEATSGRRRHRRLEEPRVVWVHRRELAVDPVLGELRTCGRTGHRPDETTSSASPAKGTPGRCCRRRCVGSAQHARAMRQQRRAERIAVVPHLDDAAAERRFRVHSSMHTATSAAPFGSQRGAHVVAVHKNCAGSGGAAGVLSRRNAGRAARGVGGGAMSAGACLRRL